MAAFGRGLTLGRYCSPPYLTPRGLDQMRRAHDAGGMLHDLVTPGHARSRWGDYWGD